MTRTLRLTVLLVAGSLVGACAPPAPVVEGTVIAVDVRQGRLIINDDAGGDARPLTLDILSAEMGRPPAAGDRVRVVYRTLNARNTAIAVMNLSSRGESTASPH